MAKNIRWQIPFVSIGGTHYRIDIYDEGTFTPVTLNGGTNPFTTSEDDSDNYFEPIRTQSGTIEVCTIMPDGNYITLDDLLPANNIARPVRLINRDNSDAIEWQGFLSCEAYDQDYTSIPQIIQLPVISVLEAMASVGVSISRMTGLERINKIIYNALHEIDIESGITNFVNIHYDGATKDIFNKYLDQSVLYSTKDSGGYNQLFTLLDANDCQSVLEDICVFMGWVAREIGADIYIQCIKDGAIEMHKQSLSSFYNGIDTFTIESVVEYPIDTIFNNKWMGTNHKITSSQGAKSVNISASLKAYNLKVTLPETPKQFLVANPAERWNKWGMYHANSSKDYYNNITFQSVRMDIVAGENHNDAFEANMTVLQSLQYENTMPWKNVQWYQEMDQLAPPDGVKSGNYIDFNTAFLNVATGTASTSEDGLMVFAEPSMFFYYHNSDIGRGIDIAEELDPNNFLYRQRSVLTFFATDGNINISIDKRAVFGMFTGYYDAGSYEVKNPRLRMAIKWGNKWAYIDDSRPGQAPLYKWGSTFYTFDMPLDGQKKLTFPVEEANNGEVTVYIYPRIKGRIAGTLSPSGILMDDTISGVLLTKIEVSYEASSSAFLSSDTENNYFRLLRTNFRDKIDISTNIATDLFNNMSPSLVMNDETTPASTILINGENIKPEVDLLNRLAAYYGAARQRLDLIVEHPTAAPLPLLRLNGISPDNRIYIPLAESRDWQQDTSTLKCFETPTEPQES